MRPVDLGTRLVLAELVGPSCHPSAVKVLVAGIAPRQTHNLWPPGYECSAPESIDADRFPTELASDWSRLPL